MAPTRCRIRSPSPATSISGAARACLIVDDVLRIDPRSDREVQILGLRDGNETLEFVLPARSERLWRYRVRDNKRSTVSLGSELVWGHDARHDTLILRSPDRDADLLVMGAVHRRPFFARERIELNAEMLERAGSDDRIALRRSSGRIDVLARITRRDDPSCIAVDGDRRHVRLALAMTASFDAVRIEVDDVQGREAMGEASFSHRPVDHALPPGISVYGDWEAGRLVVEISREAYPVAARATVHHPQAGRIDFEPVVDADGAPISLGLGVLPDHVDQWVLERLARFLAEPVPAALADTISQTLGAAYASAVREIGRSRMVGSVRLCLRAHRGGHGTPRHDLIGIAPWIFEAPATAFCDLPPATGLKALERIGEIPAAADLPDPNADAPLATWLDRLGRDSSLPGELSGDALRQAFRAMRFRLRETDLRVLTSDDRLGRTARLIAEIWSDAEDELRRFDHDGGGDPFPARAATALERFARAAACCRSEDHMDQISFRTGLSRSEAGQALTMILRAGVEFFVYFRALWSHAAAQSKDTK